MVKKKDKKCETRYCSNTPPKSRKKCQKCRNKEWRQKSPVKAAYIGKKSDAAKRGIEFSISYEYFQQFCYRTDYIQNKGSTKDCYTIDRIDNDKGYIEGNIQCLSRSENASKGIKKLVYDWQTKSATVVTQVIEEDNDKIF